MRTRSLVPNQYRRLRRIAAIGLLVLSGMLTTEAAAERSDEQRAWKAGTAGTGAAGTGAAGNRPPSRTSRSGSNPAQTEIKPQVEASASETPPELPTAKTVAPKPSAATASAAGSASNAAVSQADIVTILVTGDTGFSRNHSPVNPVGVDKYGRRQSFADAIAGIAASVDADLNFTNIETVVTDRNDLSRDTKGQGGPFNFRTHPNGIRELLARGFNVFSLANNHSMDYGPEGLKETLKHVAPLKDLGLKAYAGLGMNREEASRPEMIALKGARIAFSAIGIVTNNLERHRAGEDKPGQIAYRFDSDYALSLKRLAEAEADLRILSIHYGIEGNVRADDRQIKEWRGMAAADNGIDLVVGHHAHVVRAVERVGDRVVFYGLGNFLHHGTADMGGKGICKDYGLVARVHLLRDADGHLRPRAVEAMPVTKMHTRTELMSPASARARIHALNYLADRLPSGSGAEGMRFTPQSDGRGLYCFAGADTDPGSIGELCRGWKPAPSIPGDISGRISSSCSR